MLQEKILKKYNSEIKLKELQENLLKRKFLFGNRVSITRKNILECIENILYNENDFIECDFCNKKFSESLIYKNIDDTYTLCENCYSNNYMNCDSCGCDVFNEDIKVLNDTVYCENCYFEVKQELYNEHIIKHDLLKKLNDTINDFNIFELEFKIEKHYYSIECYAKNSYRLGSFSGNLWIDIGNNKRDLIKAIDFNLCDNRHLLTSITINYENINL